MPYFLVEAVHACDIVAQGPNASGIIEAFQRASLPPDQPQAGGWVGTEPRIVRLAEAVAVANPLLHNQCQTYATRLYEIPEGQSDARTRALLDLLRRRLDLYLSRLDGEGYAGTWAPVTVTPWAEAINGPISWWRGSESAHTSTRDHYPVWSTDPPENPRGPTTDQTHPTTAAQTAAQIAGSLGRGAEATTSLLWAASAAGAVAVVGYGLMQLSKLASVAQSVAPSRPRPTPTTRPHAAAGA